VFAVVKHPKLIVAELMALRVADFVETLDTYPASLQTWSFLMSVTHFQN
jgi:hypothetical protein